jgi:S-DNA-T family DNA segregation ATPase FtsK/SpoIIIE
MSNKKKKTTSAKSGNKPKKTGSKNPDSGRLKQEKVETINLKTLARDERTWKIIGAVSLLIATFLCVAFISYFFTWSDDQSAVSKGASILFDNTIRVNNLLGKLGALASHFFIFKAFGVASLLICTFFFVVGVNLLFSRRVFSIWRNLKYVTIGLVLLSTVLAFILSGSEFRFGGGVGVMISNWLIGIFGTVGTAALLFVIALAYIIWQFNPSFHLPARKKIEVPETIGDEEREGEEKLFIETRGNSLRGNGAMVADVNKEDPLHEFEIIEKDEQEETGIEEQESAVEKEILSDMLHGRDTKQPEPPKEKKKPVPEPELEIKGAPEETISEEEPTILKICLRMNHTGSSGL